MSKLSFPNALCAFVIVPNSNGKKLVCCRARDVIKRVDFLIWVLITQVHFRFEMYLAGDIKNHRVVLAALSKGVFSYSN